ncbi:unnamed protein product [Parnassius apollo]|uniref:(apollo) hypothetical protein n=1 Tax=Parnassius apollo TaxID=110799 RepID=A0A8S3WKD4_PARAO|nr:unnamed protein product [Parnassius apollo]
MYEAYICNIEKNISKSPKAFWNFVKSNKSPNSYPSSMKFGQYFSSKGEVICDFFNQFFKSNFLHDSDTTNFNIIDTKIDQSPVHINSIEVKEAEVSGLLKTIDPHKSAGPDGIPAIFIIRCAGSLTLPLSILYRRSLKKGMFPNIWKNVFITPVHKKGPKDEVHAKLSSHF